MKNKPEYELSITYTVTAKTRAEALRDFWEHVDEAENEDVKITEIE